MSVVYVLFEYDPSVTGPKKEHPVGVVSSEEVAEAFYQHDPKNRDWIPFNLDEVPEQTGVPGSLIPEKPKPAVDYGQLRSEVEQTKKQVIETNRRMQELTQRLRKRKEEGGTL